jgi:nitrate reductase gamma subunit
MEFLEFSETTLQEVALVFMALVYTTRLIWFFKFKAGRDRQPQTGDPSTTPKGGSTYSLGIIAMPWAMESSRKNPLLYAGFVIFHLGVVAAITMSFLIPYLPGTMGPAAVVLLLQVIIGAACIVGVLRIIRRATGKVMRVISSPDDYFSLILLTVWFASAFFAVSYGATPREELAVLWPRMSFFLLTAFFLIYVPFSKISHYLYYPFTRFWFGKSMGRRGVYPFMSSSTPEVES